MIITCTQCGVKLKVDDAKIKEGGSRLKCPKCGGIFTVYRPEAPVEAPAPAPPPVPEPAVPPSPEPPTVETPAPPPVEAPAPPYTEEPVSTPPAPPIETPAPSEERPEPEVRRWELDTGRIVVAHDGEPTLRLIESVLAEAGYSVTTVSEGVDAVVAIEREKPFLTILDVALPRIYGFEICDRLKNSEESKDVKVILIASIYDKTRYKREPSSLYGADDYIEKHHIQDCILQKVQRLAGHETASGQQAVREETLCHPPAPEEIPVRMQQAEEMRREELDESPAASAVDAQQVEAARRFARIILSDIALYNQGAVEEGIRNDSFHEVLAAELKEGRDLYDSRVQEDVRSSMDYFADEVEKFIEKKKRTMELGG
jgi:predicted Zn finger-like uncharacterized protein